MKKTITIEELANELIQRIDNTQDIQCCKLEIKNLALLAKENMGKIEVEVDWKEQ